MWGEDTLSPPSPAKSAKSWIQWCRKTLSISCSTKGRKRAGRSPNECSRFQAKAETADLFQLFLLSQAGCHCRGETRGPTVQRAAEAQSAREAEEKHLGVISPVSIVLTDPSCRV